MLRLPLLLAHLITGLAFAFWVAIDNDRRITRERLAQIWSRRLLAIFRIRLKVEGVPMRGAHMTVANHVSWLDIPVLAALEPTRFVSKSEVRDWPIAGWLARAAGTFFIRRGKGGAAPLLERLTPHLRAGGMVVLFPEGTTTDGRSVRPFHPRLLSAAIEANVPLQPVTLHYGLSRDGENVAPFIDDESLVPHVARLLRTPWLTVRVLYGPPLRPSPEMTRDALAQEAEAYVRAALPPPPRLPPALGLPRPGIA